MFEIKGVHRYIYDAAVAAATGARKACDEEDVRDYMGSLGRDMPLGAIRAALVDLGDDWLNIKPHRRDGVLVRVEVFGISKSAED